jgi:hypothetical protein
VLHIFSDLLAKRQITLSDILQKFAELDPIIVDKLTGATSQEAYEPTIKRAGNKFSLESEDFSGDPKDLDVLSSKSKFGKGLGYDTAVAVMRGQVPDLIGFKLTTDMYRAWLEPAGENRSGQIRPDYMSLQKFVDAVARAREQRIYEMFNKEKANEGVDGWIDLTLSTSERERLLKERSYKRDPTFIRFLLTLARQLSEALVQERVKVATAPAFANAYADESRLAEEALAKNDFAVVTGVESKARKTLINTNPKPEAVVVKLPTEPRIRSTRPGLKVRVEPVLTAVAPNSKMLSPVVVEELKGLRSAADNLRVTAERLTEGMTEEAREIYLAERAEKKRKYEEGLRTPVETSIATAKARLLYMANQSEKVRYGKGAIPVEKQVSELQFCMGMLGELRAKLNTAAAMTVTPTVVITCNQRWTISPESRTSELMPSAFWSSMWGGCPRSPSSTSHALV